MKLLPRKMSRKQKKAYKKTITYDKLELIPLAFNKRRRSNKTTPERGDWVLRCGCRSLGQFVGVEPAGRVWTALVYYSRQFPYNQQCRIFDILFKKPKINEAS